MVQRTSKVHPHPGRAFRLSVICNRNCQRSRCSQARCRRREHRQHHGYRQEQHILHLESYAQNRSSHEKWRRPFAESADWCRPYAAQDSPYAKSRRARVNVIICSTCVVKSRSVASNCAGAKPVAQTMSHSTARSDCMQT